MTHAKIETYAGAPWVEVVEQVEGERETDLLPARLAAARELHKYATHNKCENE